MVGRLVNAEWLLMWNWGDGFLYNQHTCWMNCNDLTSRRYWNDAIIPKWPEWPRFWQLSPGMVEDPWGFIGAKVLSQAASNDAMNTRDGDLHHRILECSHQALPWNLPASGVKKAVRTFTNMGPTLGSDGNGGTVRDFCSPFGQLRCQASVPTSFWWIASGHFIRLLSKKWSIWMNDSMIDLRLEFIVHLGEFWWLIYA